MFVINFLNDQNKVFISSLQYLCALRSAYLQQSPFIYIVKVVISLGGNEGWQTFQQTTHPAASNMPLFNSGIFIFCCFIFLIDIFEHCFNFCTLNCQASGKGATWWCSIKASKVRLKLICDYFNSLDRDLFFGSRNMFDLISKSPFFFHHGRPYLMDLGSTNKTYINVSCSYWYLVSIYLLIYICIYFLVFLFYVIFFGCK